MELLYSFFKFKQKNEKLKKKLDSIQHKIKQGKNLDDIYVKLRAVSKFILENRLAINKCKSEIYEDFDFFDLKGRVNKLKYHLNELKKAYSKNLIDKETYTLTRRHYLAEVNNCLKFIDKIKIISRSYLCLLYNQQIDLKIELKDLKLNRKQKECSKASYIDLKNKIEKKITVIHWKRDFFQKFIIDDEY